MTTVTVIFELETPLTAMEKICLQSELIDEYLAENVKIRQEEVK